MQPRVVVVAGPSGSGKSQLCHRLRRDLGWPILNLDDFYKEGDDPSLPVTHLSGGRTVTDWDHPDSWLLDEALAALELACRDGQVEVPVYELARDGRVGRRTLSVDGAAFLVAEGIFADRIVAPCRSRGLLADAVCVHNPRWLTFWRRLTRDLREGRKRPWVLLRRGVALARAEPAIVARAVAAGCVPLPGPRAYERLRGLAAGAR